MKKLAVWMPVILLLASCSMLEDYKKIKTPKYEPQLAFPLANSTFTIGDILNRFDDEGYIDSLDDGTISVVYRGHVFSVSGDKIYTIPNITNIPLTTPMNVPYPQAAGTSIKRMDLKSGELKFEIKNQPSAFVGDVSVTVTITDLKKNNQSLQHTFVVPKNNGTTTTTVTSTVSLAGYVLDLADDNISLTYTAKLASNNTPVVISPANFTFSLLNSTYSYIQGDLPNYKFTELNSDTVLLDIFRNWQKGSILFKDPRINLIVKSSYGLPIRAKTDIMEAITNAGQMPITSIYNNTYDFPYPSVAGQTKVDTFKFYGSNSNIEDVIAATPYRIAYEVSAELNPNNQIGFATDSSRFDVYVDVALPMWGRTTGLTFERDFDVDLKPFKVIDNVTFKVITENRFPVDVKMQLYFLADNNTRMDSIFVGEPVILKSASVNGAGQVTGTSVVINEAVFSTDRFTKVKTYKRLRMKGTLMTAQNGMQDVKFFNSNGMTIKMGINAGVDPVGIIK